MNPQGWINYLIVYCVFFSQRADHKRYKANQEL